MDVGLSVSDKHVLREVSVVELLVVNYIPVVILDDQGELFGGRVFEFNLKSNGIVAGALVFYGYLLFGGCLLVLTAVCEGGQRVAGDDYCCAECYCEDLCYCFHAILILNFTKLLTKKVVWQAKVLEWMAGDNRVSNFPVSGRLGTVLLVCYTNVERITGCRKPYFVVLYYANGVGYSIN